MVSTMKRMDKLVTIPESRACINVTVVIPSIWFAGKPLGYIIIGGKGKPAADTAHNIVMCQQPENIHSWYSWGWQPFLWREKVSSQLLIWRGAFLRPLPASTFSRSSKYSPTASGFKHSTRLWSSWSLLYNVSQGCRYKSYSASASLAMFQDWID